MPCYNPRVGRNMGSICNPKASEDPTPRIWGTGHMRGILTARNWPASHSVQMVAIMYDREREV